MSSRLTRHRGKQTPGAVFTSVRPSLTPHARLRYQPPARARVPSPNITSKPPNRARRHQSIGVVPATGRLARVSRFPYQEKQVPSQGRVGTQEPRQPSLPHLTSTHPLTAERWHLQAAHPTRASQPASPPIHPAALSRTPSPSRFARTRAHRSRPPRSPGAPALARTQRSTTGCAHRAAIDPTRASPTVRATARPTFDSPIGARTRAPSPIHRADRILRGSTKPHEAPRPTTTATKRPGARHAHACPLTHHSLGRTITERARNTRTHPTPRPAFHNRQKTPQITPLFSRAGR
ncbi:hypothetical protein HETIRDRAFT_105898 [Heterobasidion irregulare TC 32-1]|uniref:Uncharacterized protein n=1 Tax=Heterobasidion irregulare (strain TC 32-1) TaxID=747525 RepID=W4JS96_HETIT|nr:uncharacterized protein HETIRDRAFT_105898 [Heterobasidion irregulare TC 32-1]ETW76413.1 hypothetical protein HETIRDRAFT_105898 [Heterobasidion irregulare TC 32-1]